ncbi:ankyrin repeat-containing domain protein [Mycena rosella]|uniref:Ankyrin repeat-containing domain protein n=1 Tax=Mycena rosella TaxID=1033263 RepID=A0AAD7CUA2_MYCRO|nr:ankyrin repeat-containing domain protein [Mycena rosella]
MKQKHNNTLQLRKDGTGLWLLEGAMFINWQDNPGSLWIMGRSGTGKSVLSSAVISKLQHDTQLFQAIENCPPPPAIAFFYFDFKDKESQAMDSALRRIVLQLSAQSPHPYRALEQQYKSESTGQTLPTYQDLLKVLEELLLETGRTYIVLDALDECKEVDHRRLVDFISMLHKWSKTPLHLLITSQPREIFTAGFGSIPSIILESDFLQHDIRLFVVNELQNLPSWAHHAADRVVSKSSGMFRLAACLIVQISHRRWEEGLDKTLDNLPNDLFGIYDRFLEAIHPEDFAYAEAALRWIIVSQRRVDLQQLADAIAFDFSDPTQYIYKPNRREGNQTGLIKWFEGLAVFNEDFVTLAHASVQDYLLSKQFTDKFGCNLSPSHSHTFIAQTCIAYLLHFSDNAPDGFSDNSLDNTSRNYPLAGYAATYWSPCKRCRSQRSRGGRQKIRKCAAAAFKEGHRDIVHLLLDNGADVSTAGIQYGSALQAAALYGWMDIVLLLLQNGANVNTAGKAYGSVLQAACAQGRMDIVHILLENGADVNTTGGYYGSVLHAACEEGHTDIVRLLLDNGADVSTAGIGYGSALQATSAKGHTDIVRLLLENGADMNTTGGRYGSALQAASEKGHTDIVHLLLENRANVNATGRRCGSPLQAASAGGHTEIVRLLLENTADVNTSGGEHGSALQAASEMGHTGIVHLLLENSADVNTTGGHYGSALQAASASGLTDIVCLLLENGADVNATGGIFGSALQAASSRGCTDIVNILRGKGARGVC